jgi:hypothetical protein
LAIDEGRIDWFALDPNCKDFLGFRGEEDVEKEVGKGNEIECIADSLTVYLNGVMVN